MAKNYIMKKFLLLILISSVAYFSFGQKAIVKNVKAEKIAVIDSVLSKKVSVSFWLIKKYAEETKVVPKKESDKFLSMFHGICFGIATTLNKGFFQTNFFGRKQKLGELMICFGDFKDKAAITIRLQSQEASIIVIGSEFVRNNSIEIIASVIFHELVHLGQHAACSKDEIPSEMKNIKFENFAYFSQISFLYYMYGGVEKELEFYSGKITSISVPDCDSAEYHYYWRTCENLHKQLMKNK